MATFGRMKSRIEREINRSDVSAEISAAIISAIDFYANHPFTFNHKVVDTSASPSFTMSVPADLIDVIQFRLKNNSTVWSVLERRSYPEVDELLSVPQITGDPQVFALFNDTFYLYPAPDASTSAKVSYLYKLEESYTDSSSVSWFTDAEELIRLHAEVDLFEVVLRGGESYAHADRLRVREMLMLNRLDEEYAQTYSTNRVRNRSILRGGRPTY